MDNPALVHDTNVLTVVTSESYTDFVAGLQAEIVETLSARPRRATTDFFMGKMMATEQGQAEVTEVMAKRIYRYLVKNDYSDDSEQITEAYHQAKEAGTLAELPDDLKPYAEQVFQLIDSVFSEAQLPKIEDGRKPKTILRRLQSTVFEQFRQNPEHFIAEASRLVAEQKAAMIIERLTYDEIDQRHDIKIFTDNQTGQDFSRATEKLKKHIYDYAITDSEVEGKFVKELDTSSEIVVYAKLPRGFLIPTPVGDYNPDWAISFQTGSVRYIYFVAETKGTMSSMKLRQIEKKKIECAQKFFDEISERITEDRVKYDVVTDYGKLMDIVGAAAS